MQRQLRHLARFRAPNSSRTPLLKTTQSSFKAGRFYNVLQTDMAQEFKRKKRTPVESSTVKIRSCLNSSICVMRLDRINDTEKERYLSADY